MYLQTVRTALTFRKPSPATCPRLYRGLRLRCLASPRGFPKPRWRSQECYIADRPARSKRLVPVRGIAPRLGQLRRYAARPNRVNPYLCRLRQLPATRPRCEGTNQSPDPSEATGLVAQRAAHEFGQVYTLPVARHRSNEF